jgi:hypothetical protein
MPTDTQSTDGAGGSGRATGRAGDLAVTRTSSGGLAAPATGTPQLTGAAIRQDPGAAPSGLAGLFAGHGTTIGALLSILLGITLGLAVQQAAETHQQLRVVALIAALVIVAQGVLDLQLTGRRRRAALAVAVQEQADERAVSAGVGKPRPAFRVGRPRPDRSALTSALLIMGLAIWLGVANLFEDDAPKTLIWLSLLAAVVLFAIGWAIMRNATDPAPDPGP